MIIMNIHLGKIKIMEGISLREKRNQDLESYNFKTRENINIILNLKNHFQKAKTTENMQKRLRANIRNLQDPIQTLEVITLGVAVMAPLIQKEELMETLVIINIK